MKKIMNYMILVIALVIATNSVKAENVKIYLKFDASKISQPKVILLESGKAFYANSKGVVKIKNLILGKTYQIKIKYVKDNQENTKIRVPKIRPLKCSSSNGECFTEYHISL